MPGNKYVNLLYKSVPGRALYLAVIISFVSGILAVSFLLSRYYGFVEYTMLNQSATISDVLDEAITIATEPDTEIEYNKELVYNTDNNTGVACSLYKKRWGVYTLVTARATWKNLSEQLTALCGVKKLGGDAPTGLYLADHGHYMALAGDTYITGTCYLPALGARKAYIDGQSFKYNKTTQGIVRQSEAQLPAIPEQIKDYLSNELPGLVATIDTVISYNGLKDDNYRNSFDQPTAFITSTESIVLDNITIRGNYIVQSDRHIQIYKGAQLENIICIAPNIEVNDHFEGTLQLLASDSVIIGNSVQLHYPVGVVCTGTNQSLAYVQIGEGTRIEGMLMAYSEMNQEADVVMKIGSETQIFGTVYCAGKIEHLGKIYGSLYCNKLVLQTQRGYYENHLLNAWIDPESLEPNFISGSFSFDSREPLTGGIIQWLN